MTREKAIFDATAALWGGPRDIANAAAEAIVLVRLIEELGLIKFEEPRPEAEGGGVRVFTPMFEVSIKRDEPPKRAEVLLSLNGGKECVLVQVAECIAGLEFVGYTVAPKGGTTEPKPDAFDVLSKAIADGYGGSPEMIARRALDALKAAGFKLTYA
jgi:hypothetical protein